MTTQAEIERLTAEHERLGREIEALKAKQAEKPGRVFGVPENGAKYHVLQQSSMNGEWASIFSSPALNWKRATYLSREAAEAEAELLNMIAEVRQYADVPEDGRPQYSLTFLEGGMVWDFKALAPKLGHRFPWFNSEQEAHRHYTPKFIAKAMRLLKISQGVA